MNSKVSQNFSPISKCYALNKITYFFPLFPLCKFSKAEFGKTIYFLLFSEQKTRQITLGLSKLLCDLWNLFPFVVRNLEHKSYWNKKLLYTLGVIHKWRHLKRGKRVSLFVTEGHKAWGTTAWQMGRGGQKIPKFAWDHRWMFP